MKIIIPYLILINAFAFLLMLVDKHKAQNNLWRIPEAILLGVALVGGSVGTYGGMRLCRHKTRHPKFYIGVPVMMVIHIIAFIDLAVLGVWRRL